MPRSSAPVEWREVEDFFVMAQDHPDHVWECLALDIMKSGMSVRQAAEVTHQTEDGVYGVLRRYRSDRPSWMRQAPERWSELPRETQKMTISRMWEIHEERETVEDRVDAVEDYFSRTTSMRLSYIELLLIPARQWCEEDVKRFLKRATPSQIDAFRAACLDPEVIAPERAERRASAHAWEVAELKVLSPIERSRTARLQSLPPAAVTAFSDIARRQPYYVPNHLLYTAYIEGGRVPVSNPNLSHLTAMQQL